MVLSSCCRSVAEDWLHKPGVFGSISSDCRPFTFLYFHLKTSKFSLFQYEARVLSVTEVAYHSILSFLVQNLLTRVEEAVDKFLYWDEEVTIIEAVTSVSVHTDLHCDLQPIRCLEIGHVTAYLLCD